jgi:pimeloyl-ACP methyl ester carboxylesterase
VEPVVFIPGIGCDARVVLPQMLALGVGHAVQVIVPSQGTVEAMSEAALLMAPARFALVGQGLGGIVALDIMRRAGERVTRVALLATDPLAEEPKAAGLREARMVAARSGRLAQAMLEEVPEAALMDQPSRAEVLALQRQMVLDLGEGIYLRQCRALQRRPDQQKTLRRAAMPALIIMGAHDRVVPPRRAEFMVGLMPRAEVQVVEAGHLPTLEAADAVNAHLTDFLNRPLLLR